MSNSIVEEIANQTDEELVYKIVETKNPQVFAVLYDRYANLVFNKCISFVESKEEAQDLTHDIFLKLYLKLRTFHGQSKFSTWLYSFVYNFCVNYIQRERKSSNEKLFDTESTDEFDQLDEIDDQEILQLKYDKLFLALNQLDVEDKMIILMKYQDDFSIVDICNAFQLKESAVKMRLQRAKNKLINLYNQL